MSKFMLPKFIIFIVFFVITIVIYGLSYTYIDNKCNDFFVKVFNILENKQAPDDVVLVVIDKKSINNITWPWHRDLFSDIFDFLENEAKAKTIVFNNVILFEDTYNPESDKKFYNSLLKYNKLINSYFLLNSNIAGDVLPSEYYNVFENKSNVYIEDKRSKSYNDSYKAIVKLPKQLLLNSKYLASSILPEQRDEIVRTYMPVVQLKGKLYPSVALSAYAMYKGIDKFVLYDNYLCSADDCKTLKLPVGYAMEKDYLGNSVYGFYSNYNWYKPKGENYTHEYYSAIDVLSSYYAIKDGKKTVLSPEIFKDKIVIVGLNADKDVWEQLSETPTLKRQADMDVQATMISNMLHNDFRKFNSQDYTFLITLIFSLFIIRGFRTFKANIIYTSCFVFVYFIYYVYEYFINSYVLPLSPILTMYSVAVLRYLFTIITTDKRSELIKYAMGKYISKDVMKKIISNLDKLKLGGVRTVVTILFVDIRNFTGIAEKLPPQEVSAILNEYFSIVEPLIGKYHGIVNKYMGDGLLAVFGEPIVNNEHALNAVMCGLEIIDKVKELREKLIQEGKPMISVGIGINTGEVFAGNIGTEERLEYTVIGDNVNLAYRIEAYNQLLKTQFLISEYTYSYISNVVEVVKLSQVKIKGKSKPIDIYEVLRLK